MTQKFYCYVDETGQDTQGELFIVTVVVADQEREHLRQACEEIERDSRKGQRKWVKTKYNRRLAYIQQVVENLIFVGKLNFVVYRDSQDYPSLTVQTIARALNATGETDYKATVLMVFLALWSETWVCNCAGQGSVPRKSEGSRTRPMP